MDPKGRDKRLSAASAAASLHHANPKDLPSYPIVGLSDKESSAGAAASLANVNQKVIEPWKPDPSASASAAAVLAKDYKPAELWHPEQSSAGSRAARQAHRESAGVNVWRPDASNYGNSAAALAFRSNTERASRGPSKKESDQTMDLRTKSLRAATGAMAGNRRRADSTPVRASDLPSSGSNALNAATIAHRPSVLGKSQTSERQASSKSVNPNALDAARIHQIARSNVSREMYTSHPPVSLEVEEKQKSDTLHAAALVMAKQMYSAQQKAISDATGTGPSDSLRAANTVHGRPASSASSDDFSTTPHAYVNLQEAARKLASERLAKLHDEHEAYRTYYGAKDHNRRSSFKLRNRRRASSDSRTMDDDEEQSHQIRQQMSLFNDRLAQVDTEKRQADRDALMAAAYKNVKQQLHGIDEKAFTKTGKVTPAMMEEWEAKARVAAESDSKVRMENYGKVNIGGGKFLDQADVDAVAARNVQPALDEINDRAERQRAREQEIKLDQERARLQAAEEKQRQKEVKDELRRVQESEKAEARAREQAEKQQVQNKKDEEKLEAKLKKAREQDEVKAKKDEDKAEQNYYKEQERKLILEEKKLAKEDKEKRSSQWIPLNLKKKRTGSNEAAPSTEEATEKPDTPTSPTAAQEISSPIAIRSESAFHVASTPTSPALESEERESSSIAAPRESASSYQTPAGTTSEDVKRRSTGSSPTSPKGDSKVKNWLKGKFTRTAPRRGSKSSEPGETSEKRNSGFIGGAALTGASGANVSNSSLDAGRDSMREVAMAGVSPEAATDERQSRSRTRPDAPAAHSPSISPPSSPLSAGDSSWEEARDSVAADLSPPPVVGAASSAIRKSDSPVRDSRFSELL